MDDAKNKIRTDLDALTSSVNSAIATLSARLAGLDALAARVKVLETPPPVPERKKLFEIKSKKA